jgi:hypothetical protein
MKEEKDKGRYPRVRNLKDRGKNEEEKEREIKRKQKREEQKRYFC